MSQQYGAVDPYGPPQQGPPAGAYQPPAGAYQPPAGAYQQPYPPAGAYQPPAGAYQPPPAGAYVPSYQQPQPNTTVVYVHDDQARRDQEVAEDCCLLACCLALCCICCR